MVPVKHKTTHTVSDTELAEIQSQDTGLGGAPSVTNDNAERYAAWKGEGGDDLEAELEAIMQSGDLHMKEEEEVKAAFEKADADGSGQIDVKEFHGILETLGIKLGHDEFEALCEGHFAKLDKDHSGAMGAWCMEGCCSSSSSASSSSSSSSSSSIISSIIISSSGSRRRRRRWCRRDSSCRFPTLVFAQKRPLRSSQLIALVH